MNLPGPETVTGPALQWGRDLAITEWVDPTAGVSRVFGLQWGRDLAITEWLSAGFQPTLASGFNGAVILRSRNAAVPAPVGAVCPASMGPCSCDHGMGQQSGNQWRQRQASMGP